jgi:hypothetical protein
MRARQGAIVLLLFAAGCNCEAPSGFFTSVEAEHSARCLALRWHDDAVLQGLDTGQDDASRRLQDDGRSSGWIVTYAAPSAKCKTGGLATKTYSLQSGSLAETGNSCGDYACSVGLGSEPVDSTVVVPPAWQRLLALPGFQAIDASLVATNQYHCQFVNAFPVKRQYWQVVSYWAEGINRYQANVDFTTDGEVMAVHGPCSVADVSCLSQ